ncbi:glycosyltransferase family 4 protein [Geomonas sp. Red259]|uniref:Glycosyltransferase family 4 protein n=2 Tax=Geomonas propionica TaxID=2798582 RepID=A0ABS0YVI3_9BACT|nr:glycosyltransferase family 4 protein [Geomonas propionica]
MLRQLGCRVEVVTAGERLSQGEENGLQVVRFPVRGQGHLLSPSRGAVSDLRAFLAQGSWDVVFTHCWQAWNSNEVLDFFGGADRAEKVVLVSHGLSTDSDSRPFPLNLVRRLIWWPYRRFRVPRYLRRLDRLVLLWDHQDRDRFLDHLMARELGVPVAVVPNVARYDAVAARRPALALGADELAGGFMLCVGNYSKEKNEAFVLEAYRLSGKKHLPLIFVGHRRNPYCRVLEHTAREHGLRVEFCTGLDKHEIDWLYREASLFLFGSRTECQPLVVLDALASGTPCISTDVGCVSSLGCVTVVRSPEEMAAQIRLYVSDPELRRERGEQGRALADREFSLSACGAKWGRLMNDLGAPGATE